MPQIYGESGHIQDRDDNGLVIDGESLGFYDPVVTRIAMVSAGLTPPESLGAEFSFDKTTRVVTWDQGTRLGDVDASTQSHYANGNSST